MVPHHRVPLLYYAIDINHPNNMDNSKTISDMFWILLVFNKIYLMISSCDFIFNNGCVEQPAVLLYLYVLESPPSEIDAFESFSGLPRTPSKKPVLPISCIKSSLSPFVVSVSLVRHQLTHLHSDTGPHHSPPFNLAGKGEKTCQATDSQPQKEA